MTIEEAKNKLCIIKNSYSIRNYFHTDMTHQERALFSFENLVIDFIEEKQVLIDYLKEKITKCDKDIKIHKKEIAGVVNISENNRHILLIKRFKVEKQIYEEILSKIEKSDK